MYKLLKSIGFPKKEEKNPKNELPSPAFEPGSPDPKSDTLPLSY